MIDFVKFIKGIVIRNDTDTTKQLQVEVSNAATTATKTTLVAAQTANRTITLPDASTILTGIDTTQTLTGKTIDADLNTISNIDNNEIKAGAAIDATKLGNGTVDNTELGRLDGILSSAVGITDAQTLTNKTINADNNTISNIDNNEIKALAAIDTTKLADGSVDNTEFQRLNGVLSSVVGISDAQTLTNKTIDGDDNTIQDLALASLKTNVTDANKFLVRDGSGVVVSNTKAVPTGVVVGTTDTQTLSNKTFSDPVTLAEIATPSTPASGLGKIYFKSDGFLYQLNDDGSESKVGAGSGGINYITNPDAESNVASWATFADGATLIDGTGGSPTATLTRSTSGPLRNNASFLYTPGALGNGTSFDFTISEADKAKVLQISFDYQLSATITEGDYQVYIYDVTNSLLIQPVPYKLSGTSGTNYLYRGSFQTASNSTSYRLILWQSVATAVTLKFDNVIVGPQVAAGIIPKASTIQKFTSGSGTYTTPAGVYQIQVRMVGGGGGGAGGGSTGPSGGTGGNSTFGSALLVANGGSGGIFGSGSAGGTASLGTGPIGSIWSGGSGSGTGVTLSATQSNLGGGAGGNGIFGGGGGAGSENGAGTAAATNTGGGGGGGGCSFNPAANLRGGGGGGAGGGLDAIITSPLSTYSYAVGAAGAAGAAGTSGQAGGAGGSGYIEVTEYYLGANVQMSSGSDGGRVVAARYSTNAGQSIPNAVATIINYGIKNIDTNGAVTTGASWKYTVQESGVYRISAFSMYDFVLWGSSSFGQLAVYKNGGVGPTIAVYTADNTQCRASLSGSTTLNLVAGDYIDIRAYQDSGSSKILTGSFEYNHVSIERISGSSQIDASETVAARYVSDAGQSIPSVTETVINFEDKIYDTHNAVTIGASWKFTAPVSGLYLVNSKSYFASAAFSSTGDQYASVFKNGVVYASVGYERTQTATGFVVPGLHGQTHVRLLAGEYIDVRAYQNEAGARSLNASQSLVSVEIIKVGNY